MRAILAVASLAWAAAVAGADVDPRDSQQTRASREAMVATQIEARGIRDPRVLEAMRAVPRHAFVPEGLRGSAYQDTPLPIGEGQTISQPYIVALMTERLALRPGDRVLEIGTGSGYQAAVLAGIAGAVYSVEIRETLHLAARKLLDSLGLGSIELLRADGYWGWKERAPFDCIMITAAVDHIPRPLLDQLKEGGRLILPLGNPFQYQNLVLVTKGKDGPVVDIITGVLFVPMTGRALE